ncbi:hypothetical protein A2V49_01110 [candidate division WWE3 bacterium RBG_19FT_COMBO_34_6]|uniref:DUF5050 domain-containing protein n=1 Tax=candidate division WWE3 bacterium RBG_19FT_COMBO_34_6 TaxID=1802612 RepID=A0A1F4UKP4_UNCKA|nr:MAG: hypothetical protein A2V49_01110 [candidate division WWE3 bacterium RBG_19FT_COMBO_34_6]
MKKLIFFAIAIVLVLSPVYSVKAENYNQETSTTTCEQRFYGNLVTGDYKGKKDLYSVLYDYTGQTKVLTDKLDGNFSMGVFDDSGCHIYATWTEPNSTKSDLVKLTMLNDQVIFTKLVSYSYASEMYPDFWNDRVYYTRISTGGEPEIWYIDLTTWQEVRVVSGGWDSDIMMTPQGIELITFKNKLGIRVQMLDGDFGYQISIPNLEVGDLHFGPDDKIYYILFEKIIVYDPNTGKNAYYLPGVSANYFDFSDAERNIWMGVVTPSNITRYLLVDYPELGVQHLDIPEDVIFSYVDWRW